MARKLRTERSNETETDSTAPLPLVAPEPPTNVVDETLPELVSDNEVIGDATTLIAEENKAQVAPSRKFRVRNGGRILHRGTLTILRPGKIVDELLYDLPALREQGIQLDLMKD